MLRLIRIALQFVLFVLLLSAVIGVASGATGVAEKLVLVTVGALVVGAASPVRRLGRPGSAV